MTPDELRNQQNQTQGKQSAGHAKKSVAGGNSGIHRQDVIMPASSRQVASHCHGWRFSRQLVLTSLRRLGATPEPDYGHQMSAH